jgi:hypothetical protein
MSESRFAKYANLNPDWEEAARRFRIYYDFKCTPTTKKLRPDHIEDEDKSVKWNRQFVEENHKKHDNEVKALNRKKNSLRTEADDFVKYLICYELDWKLSDNDVDRLYSRWYDHWHDEGIMTMLRCIESECDDIREMDWWKSMKARKV